MTLSIVRAMAYHASQWRSNFQVTLKTGTLRLRYNFLLFW